MSALCFLVLTATIAISGGAQDWQRGILEQIVHQLAQIRPDGSFLIQMGKPGRPGRPGGQQSLWQQQLCNQFSRQAPSWQRVRCENMDRQQGPIRPEQSFWSQIGKPGRPGRPGGQQSLSQQQFWNQFSHQAPSWRRPVRQQPSGQYPFIQQKGQQKPSPRQPDSRQPDSRQPSPRQPDSRQPSSWRPGSRQPSARNDDYCNVKSCKRPELHTSCKFLPGQISPACGKVKSSFMNRAERDKVLEKHNDFRAKVARGDERRGSHGPQPAAKNLGNLTWNDELAEIAQKWANQCIWGHDECRDTHEKKVGQNIAYSSSSESYNAILSDLVTGWYDEVKNFNSAEVRLFKGQSPFTGHYSQLVWAKSTEVGCGLIRFNHPVSSKGQYRTQLVCNYATKGNMIDQPVYQQR